MQLVNKVPNVAATTVTSVVPSLWVTDQVHRDVEALELVSKTFPSHLHDVFSFSQNIVHEIHHVASGHHFTVMHELDSIIPVDGGVRFEFFYQPLRLSFQRFRNAVDNFDFDATRRCAFLLAFAMMALVNFRSLVLANKCSPKAFLFTRLDIS